MRFSERKLLYPILLSGIPLLFFILSSTAVTPGPAYADGISGFLDYAVSTSDSKSKSSGVDSKGTANSFTQRYGLSLDKSLFPLVRLNAGGIFDKSLSDATADGVTSHSESHSMSPTFSLIMSNPFVPAALGYSRTDQTSSGSGAPSSTNVMENYNMRLGLRPEGLPLLDARFSRSNAFDPQRTRQDTTSDSYILSSRYQPLQNLDFSYQGSLTDGENRLTGQKNQNVSNTISGSYSHQLFSDRLSLFTNGTLADNESKSSSGNKGGIIFTPVFPGPSHGLTAVTPTAAFPPVTAQSGELNDTPSLLDGSALIPIVTPAGTQPPIGTEINIGLAFNDKNTLNTLFLTVVSGGNTSPPLNIAAISNRFTWDIYTSLDGTAWEKKQTINNAPFISNPSLSGVGAGFLLNLSLAEATRFIKVVVVPPQLIGIPNLVGVNFNSIQVTKLEALVGKPASQVPDQKTASTSGLWNFGVKAKLLDGPFLPTVYYDGSYNTNFSQQGAGTNSSNFISNGVAAFYKFNRYLTGTARLSRSDSKSTTGERSTDYSYNASINTQFLSTLQQAVTYSGRSGVTGGKSSSSNSFFVTNSAALYRGISANLSGGLSLTTSASGSTGQNIMATFGTTVTPHPTLNITGNMSASSSKQSGGGLPASSSQSGSGQMTASYSPLSSLSISGTLGFTALEGKKPVITRNFGGNWSPFRDGELQFTFSYFEALSSSGDQLTRSVSPSLRWSFRSGCWVDLGYAWAMTEQTAVTTDTSESSSIFSTLRISF